MIEDSGLCGSPIGLTMFFVRPGEHVLEIFTTNGIGEGFKIPETLELGCG